MENHRFQTVVFVWIVREDPATVYLMRQVNKFLSKLSYGEPIWQTAFLAHCKSDTIEIEQHNVSLLCQRLHAFFFTFYCLRIHIIGEICS
jgi:hypothetical protein